MEIKSRSQVLFLLADNAKRLESVSKGRSIELWQVRKWLKKEFGEVAKVS